MTSAVGYIRMSSDKQEASPEQQRQEIIALAKRDGYRIIRWYIDEGVSGDATDKRLDFQRMIRDAEGGGFQAVLCWDQDRFGRFDSICEWRLRIGAPWRSKNAALGSSGNCTGPSRSGRT